MARYYFAFASNLSLRQMHTRCPDSQAVAPVAADGWRLAFFGEGSERWGRGGVATLVRDSAVSAPGALYLLSDEDESKLDGLEGITVSKYRKDDGFAQHITWPQLSADDTVFAYLMSNPDGPNPPNVSYLDVIRRGYQDWGWTGHPLGM